MQWGNQIFYISNDQMMWNLPIDNDVVLLLGFLVNNDNSFSYRGSADCLKILIQTATKTLKL